MSTSSAAPFACWPSSPAARTISARASSIVCGWREGLDADPLAHQEGTGSGARECAGEHQVGLQSEHLLGLAAHDRQHGGLTRDERQLGMASEAADGSDLTGVGQRNQELIRAQIDRDDAAGRLGGAC